MDKIKSIITKAIATWSAIGFALIAIGTSGIIDIPAEWLELFSANIADKLQVAFDLLFDAFGAFVLVAQAIRAVFATKTEKGTVTKVLTNKDRRSILWSPFKVA